MKNGLLYRSRMVPHVTAVVSRACRFHCSLLLCAAIVFSANSAAQGQLQFEAEPINYHKAPLNNPITDLQQRIDRGDVGLPSDNRHGRLKAVLDALGVPVSSQVLVFSKTSFQLSRITSQRPRALYFSDDTYVGWVQGGDVVEVSTVDPQLGAVFYTLGQDEDTTPKFVRDRGQCLICHASSRTEGVPGHLVRSVYPDASGQPFLGSGTYTTDHRSPFDQRWGGWYVTGTHGKARHLGNVVVTNRDRPEDLDVEFGANVTDLSDRVDVSPYLSPHSDIVALMVLEHQTRMHNLITRANFEARTALAYDQVMNRALDRPPDYVSDVTKRRIESAAEALLKYMLFADEFQLTDPVKGTSAFADEFAARGPFDSQGRSLRELDLTRRLMNYPCSYLIYSAAFGQLPAPIKDHVYRRLWQVVMDEDENPEFSHLSAADRRAILEILRETKQDLPEFWQRAR